MHTYIHTYIHTYMHTYIHTYIHFMFPYYKITRKDGSEHINLILVICYRTINGKRVLVIIVCLQAIIADTKPNYNVMRHKFTLKYASTTNKCVV